MIFLCKSSYSHAKLLLVCDEDADEDPKLTVFGRAKVKGCGAGRRLSACDSFQILNCWSCVGPYSTLEKLNAASGLSVCIDSWVKDKGHCVFRSS